MTNFGAEPVPLPLGIQCLAASQPVGDLLPPDTTVWFLGQE
ncbi:hypothetical protein PEM37_39500 [Streptomyces sp. AD681]|nr:hypothetical protein [Streptomyces sp. AD681]MDA5147583.1 hypothetical protein [Streptomyces sp. AD681]